MPAQRLLKRLEAQRSWESGNRTGCEDRYSGKTTPVVWREANSDRNALKPGQKHFEFTVKQNNSERGNDPRQKHFSVKRQNDSHASDKKRF